MLREQIISNRVSSKNDLISFILQGQFEGDEDDAFILDRNAIQFFEKNKCVTTRFMRLKEDQIFEISIILQEDLYYPNSDNEKTYPYSEGNWSDIERIKYIEGKLEDIENIINDKVYDQLLQKMNFILDNSLTS